MARAKKEAALTPEERLQAALVPDWEWPYKLPENWCWTYQKAVCSLSTGEKRIGNDYPYWEVKCLRGITLPQIVSSGNFVPVFSKVILVDGENSGEVFTILTSKACLPSWMRPRKRHRPWWIVLKLAKPLFSIKPSPVN